MGQTFAPARDRNQPQGEAPTNKPFGHNDISAEAGKKEGKDAIVTVIWFTLTIRNKKLLFIKCYNILPEVNYAPTPTP